jgi:mannose/fructose/N-acetylgalactosamine-specific phosphotransferase system component IIB
MIKALDEIPYVNVGNFGSIATAASAGRKERALRFSATDEELEEFREIARLRPKSTLQQVAVTNPVPLSEVVK